MLNLDLGKICKPGDMFRMQFPDVGAPLRWVTGLVASALFPTGEPAAVMVVADHSVFAEALALAIDSAASTSCVAVATGMEQAVHLAIRMSPDVAVIDLNPEEEGDFATVRALLEARPALRILLLTAQSPSPGLVKSAVEAGAAAVFPKTTSLGVVVAAVPSLSDSLFTTDRWTIMTLCETARVQATDESSGIRESSDLSHTSSRRAPSNLLTRRERDIVSLLDRGIDLPTASEKLGISVNTTRGYVKNLYRKLGVHSQVELLAVAREKGLLDDGEG
jgi:SARP family transcriptional regulator, regulator of embCAB operon